MQLALEIAPTHRVRQERAFSHICSPQNKNGGAWRRRYMIEIAK